MKRGSLLFVMILGVPFYSQAGERLNSDELRTFYSGKTVTGVHWKRGKHRTYYAPDGTVISKGDNGTERNGKWWVQEDTGKRCIRWNHKAKDFCHYVERDEDGSHTLVHGKKGHSIVEIQGAEDGNTLQ